MANLKSHKKIGKPFSNVSEIIKAKYVFADDGGVSGTYNIFTAQDDIVILNAFANVIVGITTGGASSDIAVGIDTDPDAVINEVLTDASALIAGKLLGPVSNNPIKVAKDSVVTFVIGLASVTAGEVEVTLEIAKL